MSKRQEIVLLNSQGVKRAEIARRVECSRAYVTRVLAEGGTPDLEERLEAAKLTLLKARAENEELAATLLELRLMKERGDLLPRAVVAEMFARVFASYRQAIKELDRRYGPEAARLCIDAGRRALEC